jgi:hypothetical protein
MVTTLIGEIIFHLESKDAGIASITNIPMNNYSNNENLLLFLKKVKHCEEPLVFEILKHLHDEDDCYATNFNFVIQYLYITKNKEIAKAYYQLEMKYHEENELDFYKCVKLHLGTNKKAFWFLNQKKSQSEERNAQNIKSKLQHFGPVKKILKLKNMNFVSVTIHNFLLTGAKIVLYFTDLFKDLFLIITIARFVPLTLTSLDSFAFQVFLLLLLSMIVPECINVVTVLSTNDRPMCNTCLSSKIFLSCMPPILPALSLYICSRYKSKMEFLCQREELKVKNVDDDFFVDYQTLRKKLSNLEEKETYWCDISVRMRRNENVFEHTLQAIVLVIFTALIFTQNQTVDGLQQIYANKNTDWLILSAILSVYSLTAGFPRWIEYQKRNTLSWLGKFLLHLMAFLSLLLRLTAIVIFFAPSLGLLDLLMHWKMGSLPGIHNFAENITNLPDPRKSVFYPYLSFDYSKAGNLPNLDTINEILRDSVNFNGEWKGVNSSQDLTIFSLQTYYICFLFGMALHLVTVYCIKHYIGFGFSHRNSRKLLEKMLNVVSQFAIPLPLTDWDDDEEVKDNASSDFKSNWKKVSREMKALLLLFTIENIFLLIPLFILNYTITKRNEFLDEKFPQLPEEQFSTNLVFALIASMPILYIVAPFIQYYLFVLYNKHGHPWSKIFKMEKLHQSC